MARRLAWLTGDDPPTDDYICRRLRIPNELSVIMAVNGALLMLTEVENWEQHGTATPDDIAALMAVMFYEYEENQDCNGGTVSLIGTIVPGVFDDGAQPSNWLLCDGSTYLLADYPGLAAIISPSLVSGDDFTVPDLRNRSVIGSSITHLEYQTGGAETHTLTTSELSAHYHPMNATLSILGHGGFLPVTDVVSGIGGTTNFEGGGAAHNNMSPFIALRYWLVAG